MKAAHKASKIKQPAVSPGRGFSAPIPWFPTLALLFVPIYVIFRSMTAHNYPAYAFWVQNDVLSAFSTSCLIIAAVAAIIPPFRQLISRHLDRLSQSPQKTHLAWIGAAYLGFLAWCWFIRFCQYRAYLLPQDSLINVNSAYAFIHHGVLEYPHLGVKLLSIHFIPFWILFSPILLVWNSPIPLFLIQHIFVCSIPFAMYALVYELTASSMAAFSGMILIMSNPYLYELLTANHNIPSLAAFLPWAMYFLHRGQKKMCTLLLVLMVFCGEENPFIFFGLGLFVIYRFRDRYPKNWIYGTAISVGAAALFVIEFKIKQYSVMHEAIRNFQGAPGSQWQYFKSMVPAGTPAESILREIVGNPLRSLGYLISSPYKYYPVARLLFSVGLLPLLAPAYSLPFLTTALPHILSAPPDKVPFFGYSPITYFDFGLHQGAYVFGPLVWAAAYGAYRAYAKLSAKNRQSWLMVWALFFAGVGFHEANRTLMPDWRPHWFDAMPRVTALIPPKARIWADEYASPPLSARRWVKIIQWGPTEPDGYHRLFKPDYALFDKSFAVYAQAPYRDQMLTFFFKNGYVKIADDQNVILLKSPNPSKDPETDIDDWIRLPEIDPKAAATYGQYLLRGPLSPS